MVRNIQIKNNFQKVKYVEVLEHTQQSAPPMQKVYRSSYNITADEIPSLITIHSVHLHLNSFYYFIECIFDQSTLYRLRVDTYSPLNCCGAILSQAAHLIFSTGYEL